MPPNLPRDGRRFRFVTTLASGYGLLLVSLALNLWLTPFVLRFITREEYAIFVLALDVIVWLGVMDLGLTTGLAVRLTRLRSGGDRQEMSKLASTTLAAQCVIGALVVAIGLFASRWFPEFFGVSPAARDDASFVVLAVVVGMGISMPFQTFSSILVSGQRGLVDNLIRFANFVVRVVLTVILLLGGVGLRALGVAHLVATLVSGALIIAAAQRIDRDILVRPSLVNSSSLRKLAELGTWLSIGNLATIAIRGLDRAVVGRVVSLESVTVLELTGRAYQPAMTATGHFISAAEPFMGEVVGVGDRDATFAIYRRFFIATASITMVVASALFAANGAFVSWWVGAENYGGELLDALLALNMVIFFVISSHKNLLTVSFVVKPIARVRVLEAGINLALSIFLGIRYGIVGVTAATAVAACATSLWMLPRRAARELGVPILRWFGQLLVPLLLPAILTILVALLSRGVAESISGVAGALAGAVLVVTTGGAAFWLLAFDAETRREVFRLSGFAN